MPGSIEIASNALMLIGADPISSFDTTDGDSGVQAAANLYDQTYKMLLADHPWSFALKEVELSRLSTAPDTRTNYQYAYQLPSDMIRLWEVLPYGDYVLVDGLLYSNHSSLMARYVYPKDETQLPPHFVKALEYKLASEFAMSVTEDMNKAELFERKYIQQISAARLIDSQGRPQMGVVHKPFVDVRFGGDFFG